MIGLLGGRENRLRILKRKMKTIDEKRISSVQEITHCLPNNDLLFVNSADEQATL